LTVLGTTSPGTHFTPRALLFALCVLAPCTGFAQPTETMPPSRNGPVSEHSRAACTYGAIIGALVAYASSEGVAVAATGASNPLIFGALFAVGTITGCVAGMRFLPFYNAIP